LKNQKISIFLPKIKKQKMTNFWGTLSEKLRDRINESITLADSGQKTPHHEVMARFKKQLQA
jgi:hypothetical protein